MYLEYYGLKEEPFRITSDTSFFFRSRSHQEALAHILYGIRQKKGILLLLGEVGTGKTTLCRVILKELPPQIKTSFILNPYFSPNQLIRAIIEDFGIKLKKFSRLDMVYALNEFLIENTSQEGGAVLIIDEAQNLTFSQLEQIRLLSNLETEKEKLLQIVLVGQPELEVKLNSERLRQIKQRISVKYYIEPLYPEEIEAYINFRLGRSGSAKVRFQDSTYQHIYNYSRGFPRLINILCDRALLGGFVREKYVIDEDIIKNCIEELT